MKTIPAPIDEKNISSDWLYEGLGAPNPYSIVDNYGDIFNCAFYRGHTLWEATWNRDDNKVIFKAMHRPLYRHVLDEFLNHVKESNSSRDEGDSALAIAFDTRRLYSDGIFTMSFYFIIEE